MLYNLRDCSIMLEGEKTQQRKSEREMGIRISKSKTSTEFNFSFNHSE